jgi:hypothetical protein
MTAIMVHPKHRIGSPPHILDMKKTLPTARDENDLYTVYGQYHEVVSQFFFYKKQRVSLFTFLGFFV